MFDVRITFTFPNNKYVAKNYKQIEGLTTIILNKFMYKREINEEEVGT